MEFNLEINVFTIIFMLMLFLGLQMDYARNTKRRDPFIRK